MMFKKPTIKSLISPFLLAAILSCGPYSSEVNITDVKHPVLPILANKERNQVLRTTIEVTDQTSSVTLSRFNFSLEGTTNINDIKQAKVFFNSTDNFDEAVLFGSTTEVVQNLEITGDQALQTGENYFWLSVELNDVPVLTNKVAAALESVTLSDGNIVQNNNTSTIQPQRLGIALKQAGDGGIDTYRIPGLATTNNGTLIAVYDNRYNDPVDLQEDIDVGMSRCIDGGQTWEPMKVIMDMGGYGGLPEDQNGIGDPAVLVDRNTNTIWVAALWLHGFPGERAWNASQPGISPEKTGQLMLVKSEDDGLTWSDPINITSQTKKSEWNLFFNGPGSGITMKDGTLVFAAQFKDANKIPHSTIIFSKDSGKTWQVGTGAKPETTEAQVVELSDGSLMLNMRDDRNRSNRNDTLNGRSVSITHDLGKTWTEHPTSRNALIEPNCMASLIAFDHPEKGNLLFFSNPDSKTSRDHITVKTSFDDGTTWPEGNQIELYENGTYGYSCLTIIDDKHLGILYEGVKELYFQKIPISELLIP